MLPTLGKAELWGPEDGDQTSVAHSVPVPGLSFNTSGLAGDSGKVTFP